MRLRRDDASSAVFVVIVSYHSPILLISPESYSLSTSCPSDNSSLRLVVFVVIMETRTRNFRVTMDLAPVTPYDYVPVVTHVHASFSPGA